MRMNEIAAVGWFIGFGHPYPLEKGRLQGRIPERQLIHFLGRYPRKVRYLEKGLQWLQTAQLVGGHVPQPV